MTKLERVIERLRALPLEEQEHLLVEIDFLIDHPPGEPLLTPAQEAELRRRLEGPRALIPHEDVVAYFDEKYGK